MTQSHPAASVLMPAYNSERWMDLAIASVLSQSFADFELVIVDDGSADRTPDLLAEWSARDRRIRVIRNDQNRGVAYSLNKGLAECGADLVFRMDADDIMHQERLAKQLAFMVKNPSVGILGSWARIIDAEGVLRSIRKMPVENESIHKLIWSNPIIHPSVVYRRAAILAIGGYHESARQREDYELWFRCAAAGMIFHNIPEALLDYRHDDDSFARYNFAAALRQLRIGLEGNWRLGVGLDGYVGLFVPFFRSFLPVRLRKYFYTFSRNFDPRGRS